MATDLSEYRDLYIRTAGDYMEALSKSVTLLSQNPQNHDARVQGFISSHSLKSQSLVMGFEHTGKLSAVIEKILRHVDAEPVELTPEVLKELKLSVEALQRSLALIQEENKEEDLAGEIQALQDVSGVIVS